MRVEESIYVEQMGSAVEERRKELGLSKRALAQKAGVDRDTIADFESGKQLPRHINIERIVEALEMNTIILEYVACPQKRSELLEWIGKELGIDLVKLDAEKRK